MTEKKEYQEFRRILREAIGNDKQKDYAEKVGISPEHLNRLLNNKLINCPSKATLDQIIKASPWISALELYKSCGYSNEEFRDSVRGELCRMEPKEQLDSGSRELERTFKELINDREIYSDIMEMGRDYRARFETQRFTFGIGEETENWIKEKKGSYVCSCIAKWKINLDRERCWNIDTHFALFYVKLDSGEILITDIATDGNTLSDLGYIPQFYLDGLYEDGMSLDELPYISICTEAKRGKNSPELRLLDAIFGTEEDQIKLQTLSFGRGTIWTGIPERFHEYILENEEYFSETAKETEIVDEIRDAGGYTDAVERLANDYIYNTTKGPAAIAVAILTRKSEGYEIRYDESVDNVFEPAIYIDEDAYTAYEKVDKHKLEKIDGFLKTEFKAMGCHTYGCVFVYKDMFLTNRDLEDAQEPI